MTDTYTQCEDNSLLIGDIDQAMHYKWLRALCEVREVRVIVG